MATYTESGQFFINPYNFVPVNFKKTLRSDLTQKPEEVLTGYFDCTMKCRTPLAIPDASQRRELSEEHYAYPFFSVDGCTPAVPGSALRGAIRSVYETLTDSCFGTMQKDMRATARIAQAFQPGLLILRGNSWELHEAARYLLVTDRRFYEKKELEKQGVCFYGKILNQYKTGDPVTFAPVCGNGRRELAYRKGSYTVGVYANLTESKTGARTGYLCIGEYFPRRHFQGVFEAKRALRRATKEDFERMEAVLQVYRDEKTNRLYQNGHNGYPDYERAKKNGVIPVYYMINGRNLYLSPAALGRKSFQETLNKKAGEKSHQKCDSRTQLCPACALFGTAEGEKAGSRVRFTDAECVDFQENQMIREVTFEELGSPKISYLPFYLREGKNNTDYSEGYDSSALEIRGRKFYWHHMPDLEKQVLRTKRNGTFDVADGGTQFRFRIYFDRISRKQLEWLALSIHLNDNDPDGRYCHKLGHGKPLGYGSVKISINGCRIRQFTENGWTERCEPVPLSGHPESLPCDKKTYDALRKICDFDAVRELPGIPVSYPRVKPDAAVEEQSAALKDNVLASHKWFSENYKLGSKRPKAILPEILDDNVSLEEYLATNIEDRDWKEASGKTASPRGKGSGWEKRTGGRRR